MAAAPQRGVASYAAGFPVWALAWAHQPTSDALPTRLAAGSLRLEGPNVVQLLQYNGASLVPTPGMRLLLPAPAVAIEFAPQQDAMLATAGDALRVWRLDDGAGGEGAAAPATSDCRATMRGPESVEWSVPYTSAAWSASGKLLAVGSVDGSVTLWDPETGQARSRWPAHGGPRPAVHRVAWRDVTTLLTAGADGDALLYDVRTPLAAPAACVFSAPRRGAGAPPPLRHAAWAPGADADAAAWLLAVATSDAESAFVVDVRAAGASAGASAGAAGAAGVLSELVLEQGCINALAWAPKGEHSHLAGALSDGRMVIWSLPGAPQPSAARGTKLQAAFEYTAAAELNAIAWTGPYPGRVAVAHGSTVQVLVV